jgi:glucose-1-phosphate thymidylyltransferase
VAAQRPVGLLPAAGRGTRFHHYRAPKELFPLLLRTASGGLMPTPISTFALNAMKAAQAERCLVAISDGKSDVIRTLGDGSDVGVPLAYAHQCEPRGLTDVVRLARPWIQDRNVLFAMPDTIFFPEDALAQLHARLLEDNADVVAGVFLAAEPERLGVLELDDHGEVIGMHDKPGHRKWPWCWGVLAWSPRFTHFCCEWEQHRQAQRPTSEGILGHAMEAARLGGLRLKAHRFPDGAFLDVGTPAGLATAVDALAKRGLLYGAPG